MRREWIEMWRRKKQMKCLSSLPPCGGSGLKFQGVWQKYYKKRSPSMRREWIEIFSYCNLVAPDFVSLHAEGVD